MNAYNTKLSVAINMTIFNQYEFEYGNLFPESNSDTESGCQIVVIRAIYQTILMSNAVDPEFWKNPRFCPQYFYFLKPELFEPPSTS